MSRQSTRSDATEIRPTIKGKTAAKALSEIRRRIGPRLVLEQGWILTIRRPDARHDENPDFQIVLGDYWLPPNGVYPTAKRLSDHVPFAAALVLALDAFIAHTVSEKGFAARCKTVVVTLAKFFEYLWTHNIFELSAVSPDDWHRLIESLGCGGWQRALQIRDRLASWVLAGGDPKTLVSANRKNIVTERFAEALGTNVVGQEAALYATLLDRVPRRATARSLRAAFESIDDIDDEISSGAQYSRSTLREVMLTVNHLFELPLGVGTSVFPYPHVQRFARRYGKPPSRTRNLGVAEAGDLLTECVKWIYQIGPKLVELISAIADCVAKSANDSRVVLGHELNAFLQASELRAELDSLLPSPILHLDSERNDLKSMTVRGALLFLYTAVFIVVASMNARRRDEILHRKYGIHQGFIVAISEELGLYQGEFYIEKTLLDYEKFYVNQFTVDACALLESVQTVFDRTDRLLGHRNVEAVPERERSLFSYRRMSRIFLGKMYPKLLRVPNPKDCVQNRASVLVVSAYLVASEEMLYEPPLSVRQQSHIVFRKPLINCVSLVAPNGHPTSGPNGIASIDNVKWI